MSNNVNKVVSSFTSGEVNCSQAQLLVYGPYLELPEELAIKVAAGFGGGMGAMGKTCGAVTGAFMVLGLTYELGESRNEVYGLIREFTDRFIARHGTISCNELLGYDMSTPEGSNAIREQKLTATICPGLNRSAAEIIEELLGDNLPGPDSCR